MVARSLDVTDIGHRIVLHAGNEPVVVPGGNALLTADFHRLGPDLFIHGQHGFEVLVHDYFSAHTPALITETGLSLNGDLITTLSRPEGYLQLAEDQTAQADVNGGAQPIGKVDSLSGSVDVHHTDGSTAHLAQGAPVFQNDVIQTGPDGQVDITFIDGTAFALSEGARMTLDDLVYNSDGKDNSFTASVLQGTFIFTTGKIAPSGHMEVKTPVGTVGIRGTTVGCSIEVDGNDSTCTLFQDPAGKGGHTGKVEVTNAGGSQILDTPNASTRLTSFFAAPTTPFTLPPQDVPQLHELLKQFYEQHGGTPTHQGQGDEPGKQGALHGDHIDQAALQQAIEDAENFSTAAGPGDATAQSLGSSSFDPLAHLIGFVPPPSTPVSFTSLGLSGQVVFAPNDNSNDSFGDTGSHITRDNENPTTNPTTQSSSGDGGPIIINGTPGNDDLSSPTDTGSLIINGNDGDDVLTGSSFDDQLFGGGGNDTLIGGAGNDQAFGDAGNDTFDGGTGLGNDHYDGGAGLDTVEYTSATMNITVNLTTGTASGDPDIGSDTLMDIENVTSGSGDDTITGSTVANVLDGGAGNDTLIGLGGDDTLKGGSGTDVAVFSGLMADYSISRADSGTYIITDNHAGRDGTDSLVNVEQARFSDGEINLADLPSTPVDIDDATNNSVLENAALGTLVGITVNATTAGDQHVTYTLKGDTSDGAFQIDPDTGRVSVADGSKIDYETATDHQYQITVQANNGDLSSQSSFTIAVGNINEAPSASADHDDNSNTVQEGAASGTLIGITAAASDPDGTDLTYSLVGDTSHGGFQIDAGTGIVTVADGSKIDYETAVDHQYQITVQASDGSLSTSTTFTIGVTNVNEAPSAPADTDSAENTVTENATTGTEVGIKATSTDADGPGLTYSLAGDTSHGGFQIDAGTGVVTVADGSKIDYETAADHQYQITVQASDGSLSHSTTFTIDVAQPNQPPSAPDDADRSSNLIQENADTGTLVGITASSTDPESQDVTYSLIGDTSHGGFQIDAHTGVVTVADGSKIDYETVADHQYQITVEASDGSLGNSTTFSIGVTQPIPPLSSPDDVNQSNNLVQENADTGTLVGITASSTAPEGHGITYSLTGDSSHGGFQIDAGTGIVTVADGSKIDYETAADHQYQITVEASDGSSTSQNSFAIGVANVNEAPSAPVDTDSTNNTVTENATTGTEVGIKAASIDPDGLGVTYTLIGDSSHGGFQIDAGTGIVTVADGSKIDYESVSTHQYQITVEASDGSLNSQSSFIIGVTNVNEAPSAPADNNSSDNTVLAHAATGAEVGITARSTDPEDHSITYSLVNDTSNGGFQIDGGTGIVTVADGSKISTADGSYEIKVQASDGSLTNSNTFSIQVGSVVAPTIDLDADNSSGDGTSGYLTAFACQPVAIADSDTVITTGGDTMVASAVISLTGVVDQRQEALIIAGTLPAGITVSDFAFNNGIGSLTLTGLASAADYAAALQAIQYQNNADEVSEGYRFVNISVTDADGQVSNNAVTQIGINTANQVVSGNVTIGDPLIVGDTGNGYLDVQAGGHALAHQIIVGNNKGADGTMTLEAGSSAGFGADTVITVGNTGIGYLNIFGSANAPSEVAANSLTIGDQTSGNGTVTVSGDGAAIATSGTGNAVWVGNSGQGSLIVQDGGQVKTLDFEIGIAGTGTATVTGSGSKITVSTDAGTFGDPNPEQAGFVRVGTLTGSDGRLNIENGASLEIRPGQGDNSDRTNPALIIAEEPGSKGFVYLDGAGSSLVLSMTAAADPLNIVDALKGPALVVGEMGWGQMTVSDQATATLTGEEAYIDVGAGNSDPDDTRQFPQSNLQVSSGGQVTVTDTHGTDGGMIVGDYVGGVGLVVVDGSGSSITLSSLGGARIGRSGTGDLLVQNGGHVEITADGGNGLQLGSFAGGTGSVVVDGANSEIETHGTDNVVDVGYAGNGILSVTDGGLVSTLQLEIGRSGTGIVDIRGAGSTIVASNDGGRFSADGTEAGYVEVGGNTGSSGTLTIQEGGSLIIRPGATVNTDTTDPELNIARQIGSSGTVMLTGQDSHIDISMTAVADPGDISDILLGPALVVGEMGNGQMTVTDKATVSVTGNEAYVDVGVGDWRNPTDTTLLPQSVLQVRDGAQITVADTTGGQGGLLIGDFLDGNGKIIVNGSGAKITVISEGGARVGRAGTGELDIQNDGQVTITSDHGNTLRIGQETGSTGLVTVTGSGSTLATKGVDNIIEVGQDGTGNLTVSGGGLVSTLDFEIGINGTGTATITGAGSKVIASNDGGNFTGDYTDEAGYVRVGNDAHSNGHLIISDGGLLEIRAGEAINTDKTAPELDIAAAKDSIGLVEVEGAASAITVTGSDASIYVGLSGDGTLTIAQNATVDVTGDNATVAVGGNYDDPQDPSPTGSGTLDVNSGGRLTITGTEAAAASFTLGDEQNGNGQADIEGGEIDIVGGSAVIGNSGRGALTIGANGILVIQSLLNTAPAPGLTIARNENSTGSVRISGANTQVQILSPTIGIGLMEGPFLVMAAGQSLFDVSDHAGVTIQGSGANMVIGSEATGIATADITGGATVTVDGQEGDATVIVANQIGSSGSLTIDGAGSHLTVRSDNAEMLIGANLNSDHSIVPSQGGEAHVTVSNGGTLDVGSVAEHGAGATEILIGAHGSLDIANGTVLGNISDQGGQIDIGHDVVSTASLIGNLDMSAPTSTLDIDASGTAAGQADKLNVTGNVAMSDATIDFHFLNNYTPHAGDTFSFLTASGRISLDPADLSVVAHNVDPDFRFELQQSGQDLQFHATTDDSGGTSDVFLGGNHNDTFTATTGSSSNALFGGDGDDTLTGSNGGNLIQGGSGADHMTGGSGADTFSFTQHSDGTEVESNGAVSTDTNYDHILNFDAAKDTLNFSSNYFHSTTGVIDSTNFSKISTVYDGTNGTSSAYACGHDSFILDSNNNLIYDNNGSGAGYTIVAHIDVASGSPAITAHNLHADVATA